MTDSESCAMSASTPEPATAGGEAKREPAWAASTAEPATPEGKILGDEASDGVGNPEQETEPEPRTEDQLRELLGLEPRGYTLGASVRLTGWIVTLLVGALAAVTRLVGLGSPHEIMFDETYYVKDAYALWHNGYESTWTDGADAAFARGDFSHLTAEPSFVVHPQLGKWLIALGAQIGGWDSAFGWRLATAVAGIVTVVLLMRVTMRLTHSPALAAVAGLLCTLDGVALTESRIALLDGFLAPLGLATLYCLMRDRVWVRERLAARLAGTLPGAYARVWWRPWLLTAGIMAGLTCSIKWSGAYLLAVVGLTVVWWDVSALRAVGALGGGLLARLSAGARAALRWGSLDFVYLVPTAFGVYVAGWWSWFAHSAAYKHGWAAEQRTLGHGVRTWLPDSLNDLLEYHLSMYRFHIGLHSSHPYMSKPEGWLLQWRPTSVFWKGVGDNGSADCGSSGCVRAITTIGTIPLWWLAIIGVIVIIVVGLRHRDWRLWVVLAGYAGFYLPWFAYRERTIFTFYSVAFEPYVVLALTLALAMAAGLWKPLPGTAAAHAEASALEEGEIGCGRPAPRGRLATVLGFGYLPTRYALPAPLAGVPRWRQRTEGLVVIGCVLLACTIWASLWWPIWTGQLISYDYWRLHMLLPSWI